MKNKDGSIMVLVVITVQVIMICSLFLMQHMALYQQTVDAQIAHEQLNRLAEGLLNYGILAAQEGHKQIDDFKKETKVILHIVSLPEPHGALNAQITVSFSENNNEIKADIIKENQSVKTASCTLIIVDSKNGYEIKKFKII